MLVVERALRMPTSLATFFDGRGMNPLRKNVRGALQTSSRRVPGLDLAEAAGIARAQRLGNGITLGDFAARASSRNLERYNRGARRATENTENGGELARDDAPYGLGAILFLR